MSTCAARFGFVCCCSRCQPAPSPQPESLRVHALGEPVVEIPLSVLRTLLATQGLTLVGPAERAVLDACAALMACTLRPGGVEDNYTDFEKVANAELDRRAAREQKGEGNG